MRVYDAIVKNLEHLGVDAMFGGSGEADATLLLALRDLGSIKTVLVRNEQAASFMACGYAMFAPGRLGVCFATAGPGAFNLFSGLAVALSDSLPVLALSGYVATADRGKGALNESSGLSRTPDSQAMFAATTKRSWILTDPAQTCDVLEEAVDLAFQGRPGPVHIHVSEDLTREGVVVENFRMIQVQTRPVAPDPAQVKVIADALVQAVQQRKKILALLGYGALRSGAAPELRALLERLQIPFASTMDGKGVLPENHPLALGVYGTSGDPGARAAFAAAEVVLAIGNSFAQNATFHFHPDLYRGKLLIHINIDPKEIGKVYQPDHALIADAKLAATALLETVAGRAAPVEPARVIPHRYHSRPIEYAGTKVHPGQLVQALSDLLPENSVVLGDAGGHMLWLSCFLELDRGQVFQNPGSFGPMASHVNGGIGVKCAFPDRHVIVGCGDGAYLMGGFELLTAVEHKIPVVWIIFNNGEYNIVRYLQERTHHDSAFTSFRNPDYVGYARACGA